MKHPDKAVEGLLSHLAHPMLATIDLSLGRMEKLMALLGDPQLRLPPVVHVAGTNGKGSLLAYLTAILQAAGYKVHRYISPHLVQFNERIMLADHDIDNKALVALLTRVQVATKQCPVTFFEATTAAAFLAFSETPADIVLLETGLGGRFDATNLLTAPLLTAITPISIDHTEFLGDTIAQIAGEKAGIIKRSVPVVTGPQTADASNVIEREANIFSAPLFRHGHEWSVQEKEGGFLYRSATRNLSLPLPALAGEHQINNAATAIACAEQLGGFLFTEENYSTGISTAYWPARLQRLQRGKLAALLPAGSELWLDGGHNPGAGEILAHWITAQKKPVHLITAMLKNKDVKSFLKPLATQIVSLNAVTIEKEPLSLSPDIICDIATQLGIENHFSPNIKYAIQAIVKSNEKEIVILICGSLYLAGNILWQNSLDA